LIQDPNQIDIKVSKDIVDSCFTPIIQSGGRYDIRVSAQSNTESLSSDVIICSLGARYKGYCANLTRSFMIDPCPSVESTYAVLLATFDKCLEQMTPGNELKDVYEVARTFLAKSHPHLSPHLPKSLGFAIGLEFRDATLVLNGSNATKFTPGMVFNLSVGFQNVSIPESERSKTSEALRKAGFFSLLLADTVCVVKDGIPDILTKASKDFDSVSYNLSGDKEETKTEQKPEIAVEGGRNLRARDEKMALETASKARANRQHDLMQKKLNDAIKRMEALENGEDEVGNLEEVADLQTYRSSEDYPKDVLPHQLKVDLDKETLIVPISGQPVPFHISTIKSVIMPEPDRATYLRINFYSSGAALGKDAPKNIAKLVAKYGEAMTYVKDLTYRSLDSKNLTQVFRLFHELRKRVRQREQKAEQEKHLVVQDKLVRLKDQRVPRLQDLTMRPQITGRKCMGTLESHENGLRFLSTRGEVLDVMYANVKHAIFQPCERSTMVVIHFHLKEFIMIGKKKQKDVQFFTEVIDASLNLEGARRSSYDPDEIENEQQEREMKKRLNAAFKDFCKKVQKLAQHFEFDLEFDIPYVDLGFYGSCNKEMVFIQPTVKCLVNLTETPFFVIDLDEVEHVHFERVMFSTKNFDMTFIFKNKELTPRTITAIEVKGLDAIQEWLSDVDITYTAGGASMNWVMIMKSVRDDDRFYFDVDEDGEKKPAGWLCLSAESDEEQGSVDSADEDSNFEVVDI
jgi:nucleosome binding factor SPN SPT16 subunit